MIVPSIRAAAWAPSLGAALLVIALAACAPPLRGGALVDDRAFRGAEAALAAGGFREAHAAFLSIADNPAVDSRTAEQARFRAAAALIHHKNPERDYALAARELEAFTGRYPESDRFDEAAALVELIRQLDRTRTEELLGEVAALSAQVGALSKDLRHARRDFEEASQERDRLAAEKPALLVRLEGLLADKSALISEKTSLLRERDGLARDKTALAAQVDNLTRERDRLTAAKLRLEKSLRELMALDVKMERKRKNVKEEGRQP